MADIAGTAEVWYSVFQGSLSGGEGLYPAGSCIISVKSGNTSFEKQGFFPLKGSNDMNKNKIRNLIYLVFTVLVVLNVLVNAPNPQPHVL